MLAHIAVVFVVLPAALGYINDYSYDVSSPFAEILQTDFGMVRDAEIKIDATFLDPGTAGNDMYFMFLVVDRNSRLGWYSGVTGGGISVDDANAYCNRPSTFRMVARESTTFEMSVPDTDRYSVIALQCYDVAAAAAPVSLQVTLTMSNPTPRGSGVSYIEVEMLPMIPILQVELGLFSIMVIGLVTALAARPLLVKEIHFYFLIVLLLAFLGTILRCHGALTVNDSGYQRESLDAEISLIKVFQVTGFYTCSLLLSFGYSVYRPRLPSSETKFIIGVMTLFFAFDLFKASCKWKEVDFCESVDIFLFLLRGVIIISTLLGANYTVSQLRNGVHSTPWSPTLPVQYYWLQKCSSWRNLYILYNLFPTFFTIIETTMLSWKSQWIVSTLDDFLTVFVYMGYGIIFAPFDPSEVLRGFDGSLRDNIE
jgi:hypothetical protein